MAANLDTPTNVKIETMGGVIAWLVGRVGPTAALAIVLMVYFGWDRDKANQTNAALNNKILEAFTQRTVVETEHVSLLKAMQSTLAKIDEKLDREKRSLTP